ncbi:MAG: CotH kinase family protein [Spirochaetales bacterium]|nr:CotH kinase family protein [Spirochaetales bacterium]
MKTRNNSLIIAGIISFLFLLSDACLQIQYTSQGQDLQLDYSPIKINEVVALNHSSFTDQFGNHPDWIELVNTGTTRVNLKGCWLSDNKEKLKNWQFGSYPLQPGEYLVICTSGKDINTIKPGNDTHTGITPYLYDWADEKNNPPGLSYVRPALFDGKVYGKIKGKRVISALMYLDDNAGTDLIWSDANVKMNFHVYGGTRDFSAYNLLTITGTIERDKKLQVLLCQKGIEDWLTYNVIISGTGKEDDEYLIPIKDKKGLDLTALTGIRFDAVEVNDTITIKITDIIFKRSIAYFHANFKISPGETLYFSSPAGDVVDEKSIQKLPADVSLGAADDSGWFIFETPTPGKANHSKAYPKVTDPVTFIPNGGFFNSPVFVELIHSDNTSIHYTLDGSLPDRNSPVYTEPVFIDETTVIRCIAYKEGEKSWKAQTNTYFIGEKTTLPVVSLAADPFSLFDPVSGMYMAGPGAGEDIPYFGANFWVEREIPVYIEFFEPDDRTEGFSHDAGLQIFGNWSRSNPKKSLAVFFRNEYGPGEIEYALFPDYPGARKFDSFILRNNGGNYQGAMIEDALQCSLVADRGVDYQKYRPCVVFINGRYWGIHNIREKLNAGYLYTNYGLDKTEVDLIKGWGEVQAGSRQDYDTMMGYIRNNNLGEEKHYRRICEQIDIDNYMNYYLSEIYFGNTDWPANNNKWWRSASLDNKWRWIIYDTDGGFGSWGQGSDLNMLTLATEENGPEWPNPPWSTLMLRKMLENRTFRTQFINRAATLLNTNFRPDVVIGKIGTMVDVIRPEIPRDFIRWNSPVSNWEERIAMMKTWAQERPEKIRRHFIEYFHLDGTATLTLDTNRGDILVDTMPVREFPFTGIYFMGLPITLQAVSENGKFKQWSDGMTSARRIIVLTGDLALTAEFEEHR